MCMRLRVGLFLSRSLPSWEPNYIHQETERCSLRVDDLQVREVCKLLLVGFNLTATDIFPAKSSQPKFYYLE